MLQINILVVHINHTCGYNSIPPTYLYCVKKCILKNKIKQKQKTFCKNIRTNNNFLYSYMISNNVIIRDRVRIVIVFLWIKITVIDINHTAATTAYHQFIYIVSKNMYLKTKNLKHFKRIYMRIIVFCMCIVLLYFVYSK